jgi:hypothetical protein
MTNYTHQTALTQFVEAWGIRFAYRLFGKAGELPLVFNQHYTGTMDYWDPLRASIAALSLPVAALASAARAGSAATRLDTASKPAHNIVLLLILTSALAPPPSAVSHKPSSVHRRPGVECLLPC